MNPATKRFVATYQPVYDSLARRDMDQEDREELAVEIADAFEAANAKSFRRDLFVLLATDPLCTCAGPDAEAFAIPCPFGREIRVGMHLSDAVDGRSKAWQARKPVVRCVSCGSAVFLPQRQAS